VEDYCLKTARTCTCTCSIPADHIQSPASRAAESHILASAPTPGDNPDIRRDLQHSGFQPTCIGMNWQRMTEQPWRTSRRVQHLIKAEVNAMKLFSPAPVLSSTAQCHHGVLASWLSGIVYEGLEGTSLWLHIFNTFYFRSLYGFGLVGSFLHLHHYLPAEQSSTFFCQVPLYLSFLKTFVRNINHHDYSTFYSSSCVTRICYSSP